MSVRLFFVRHGETDLNRDRKMQGVSDNPLNDEGREQLARTAGRLAGEGIETIYASDLRRAVESAEIIGRRIGVGVETDPRLREQDMGEWEGESWPELPEIYPPEDVARFMTDLDFAPPGGETKRSVRDRMLFFFGDLVGRHEGETVLVVSHGGVFYLFLHHVLEMPFTRRKRFYSSNAGLSEFLHVADGWRLLTFDETHYLTHP